MSESGASTSRMGSSPKPLDAIPLRQTNRYTFNLPNIPNPINGMIKTYENSQRSFTRPYSAKTVFFYKEGDNYFTGLRVPISKARYRNMDSLMDDLNTSIAMPFGVRRLHTPYGRTQIQSLDQLQHLGKYVVSSSRFGKPLDIDQVERHQQKMREIAKKRWERLNDQNAANTSTFTSRFNNGFRTRTLGILLPLTAKQLFFVLNGHPGRIYRVVLNPYRRTTMEYLLEEVSRGLEIAIVKIFTFHGEQISTMDQLINLKETRVLALPRHEKPIFSVGIGKEAPSLNSLSSLPPIYRIPQRMNQRRTNAQSNSMSTTSLTPINPKFSEQKNHSIERTKIMPQRTTILPPRRTFNYRSQMAPALNQRPSKVAPPTVPYSKSNQNRRVTSLKPRKPVPAPSGGNRKVLIPGKFGSVGGNSNNSASGENDSDSGRPRSTDFEEDVKESMTRTTIGSGRTEMNSDDDYPELNGALSDVDSVESPPPSHDSNVSVHSEAGSELNHTRFKEQEMDQKEKAAVTIQAYTRGYLTRKKLKRPQTPGSLHPETEDDDLDYSEPEQSEHFTEPEDNEILESEQGEEPDHASTREKAAVTIQKHWRGYEVRKNLAQKHTETPVNIEEGLIDTDDENELHETLDSSMSREAEKEKCPDGSMTYLVRVFTGNRWAADTEADLHIVLHGDDGDSEKRILQQDSQNPKFVQGQVDDFLLVMPPVGKLRKITIGHDHRGYGAGLFIDQVIILEGNGTGRMYLFQCYKWFDSGQVDGKLERILNCTATYQGPLDDLKKSQGRWELLLHNGQVSTGLGATTSNLNLFGYSHDVMAKSIDIYDNTLAQVPSVSLIQVDFGAELANLTKVRIEIDGSGEKPDYYLDYVELNDLDTDEKIEVRVSKWLKWNSDDKGAQAFRELVIFKGTPDTLPLCTYDGKLRVLVNKIPLCKPNVKVELFGENGESGVFPVSLENKDGKKDKFDVSFRIEAANLGRNIGIRIYFDPTEEGAAIYDGLGEIQRIFDKLGVENSVGDGCFIIQHGLIRESTHTPYRMVLEHSRIVSRVDDTDSFVLELQTTRMEGLSTKISKSKTPKKKPPNWIVSMLIDEHSTLLPAVTLCGTNESEQMQCLDTTPVDGLISYNQKNDKIGQIKKIRISIDRSQRLNLLPDEELAKPRVVIKKIRVNDGANGDIIHFPAATAEFFEYSIVEYPAIWPDIQPIESVFYELTVFTDESETSTPFRAHFNIIGEMGDTGYRYFGLADGSDPIIFEPGLQKSVQLEALNIGEIQTIEAHVESNEEFFWKIAEIVVHSEDGLFYMFRFEKPFTLDQNRQICHVSPMTAAL